MPKPINPSPELKAQLEKNLAMGFTPHQILAADQNALLVMQHKLGLGFEWGKIDIPAIWMPAGRSQNDARRCHTLSQFLPEGMATDAPVAQQIWTEVVRYAVTRLTHCAARMSAPPKYSTLAGDLCFLKPGLRTVAMTPMESGAFWSRLCPDGQTGFENVCSIIGHFHRIGALPDAPSLAVETVTGDEPERSRQDEPETEAPADATATWQPLPLPFVAQMGWRSVRLVRVIASALMDAIEASLQVPIVTHSKTGRRRLGERKSMEHTVDKRNAVIQAWTWQNADGKPIEGFGFDVDLGTPANGKPGSTQVVWPPRTLHQAMLIAHALVKPAHLWMVLLGNGHRNSEAVSMRTDCLVPAANGNYKYRHQTFKLSGLSQGVEVDAVVPELITQSILQQARLARLAGKYLGHGGEFLWVGATKKNDRIHSLSDLLNSYVDTLGLRYLLDPKHPSCHEHRFRKTLAYLIATTLTNAIMVVKDCFGHKDDMMSLVSYILSDPKIAREVIQIQKEMTILRARDAVQDMDNLAGPGAPLIKERAKDYLKRIGKSAFEPADAYEFARIETFDGRTWMLVGPGILCTAPHGMTQVSTPCAVGQNSHNPSRCKTGCSWQVLLSGYFMTQADDTVQYAIEHLQRAVDADDEAMTVFWQGQINTWLWRYEKVTEKWQDHPLVKRFAKPSKAVIALARAAA